MNSLFYWQCEGARYHNWYFALEHSLKKKVDYTFEGSIERYQSVLQELKLNNNNTDLVNLDFDYDLEHLKDLRSNYDYIRVCYSGGSDSHTILTKAFANDIWIDEVLCVTYSDRSKNVLGPIELTEFGLNFLSKNKNKYGKLVHLNPGPAEIAEFWDNPNFLETNNFSPVPNGPLLSKEYYHYKFWKEYGKTITMGGWDKPKLVYSKGNWYCGILDGQVHFNVSDIFYGHAFYVCPENIRGFVQKARKLRNFIKKYNSECNDPFNIFSEPNHLQVLDSFMFIDKGLDTYYDCLEHVGYSFYRTDNALHTAGKKYVHSLNNKHIEAMKSWLASGDLRAVFAFGSQVEKLLNKLPSLKKEDGKFSPYPGGKFCWFLNLDTLEITKDLP